MARLFRRIFITLWILFGASSARADLCDFYKRFLPKIYEINCKGMGRGTAKPGASYSTFGSAFNLNPATTPTEPSPYGIETIASRPRITESGSPRWDLSVVKGFQKIGASVTTAGNETFYGNSILQRIYGETPMPPKTPFEEPIGKAPNLNLGTAVKIPVKKLSFLSPALGVSIRYNKTTNTTGAGTGISLSHAPFSLGFGMSREKISRYFDPVWFYSAVAGLRIGFFGVEYTYLWNGSVYQPDYGTSYELNPIRILTATISFRRFIFSGARRELEYLQFGKIREYHGSFQYLFNSHLALGYLYNHIPGSHSLAAQIFL